MLVHADEAGDGGPAAPVDPRVPSGSAHRPVRPDRGDAAMIDQDGLVRPRRGAGAVDHEDMLDRGQRPALADQDGRAQAAGAEPGQRRDQAGQRPQAGCRFIPHPPHTSRSRRDSPPSASRSSRVRP